MGLRDLREICGEGHSLSQDGLRDATELAATHSLSFYDAAHWALARELDATLITADRKLIVAGAGVSPIEFVRRGPLFTESYREGQ